MDVSTQSVNTNIKWNPAWQESIVGDVSKKWDNWDSDRQTQLTWKKAINQLLDMVEALPVNGNIKLKDSAIRRIYRTMVARTYNSTFKTPANMFTVELEGEASDSGRMDFAYKMKQLLLNVLKKAKTKQELLEGIRNLIKAGELILFVTWKKETELQARKEGFKFEPLGLDMRRLVVRPVLKYEGVDVENLDPESFVYDAKRGDFAKAFKIYRTYATYNDIVSNQTYKGFLSKDAIEKLRQSTEGVQNSQSNIDNSLKTDSKGYKDGMIEVLHCYGDYALTHDGKTDFYPNMKITVIAREFVGCFMYNPYVQNPFILHYIEKDPSTGRGIPPLCGITALSASKTEILNSYYKALGLSIEKCWLAPIGAFDGVIKVEKNGIIGYKDDFGEGLKIKDLDMSTGLNYAIQGLEYLNQEQQEETQVYRQSAGDSKQQPQTLGQSKLLQQNQDIIESCDNDLFHDNVVLGLIEKIASYMANFKEGEETIKYKDGEGKEYIDIVDDEVRQGDYVYLVNDSSTSIEKKMNITEYMDILFTKVLPYAQATGQGIGSIAEILNNLGSAYEQERPTKLLIQPQQGGMIEQGIPTGDVPLEQDTGLQGLDGATIPPDIGASQI